ncbi:hypothetical protein D3C75_1086340 [compost metagenome]
MRQPGAGGAGLSFAERLGIYQPTGTGLRLHPGNLLSAGVPADGDPRAAGPVGAMVRGERVRTGTPQAFAPYGKVHHAID